MANPPPKSAENFSGHRQHGTPCENAAAEEISQRAKTAKTMNNKNPPLAVTCPAAKEIYLYATGEYDEERATDIETHLLACVECETLLDSLDDPSDAIIRALATLPTSPDDENSYQQLRTAALAQPVEIPQAAAFATQLQRLNHLADPALGPLPYLLGNYELQTCIGRGASGAVYRARHLKLDQTVAVKVLDPSRSFAADSFLQEMKTIGSLAHPHIVRANRRRQSRRPALFGDGIRRWHRRRPAPFSERPIATGRRLRNYTAGGF